jgi:hypothetical protein
LREIDRVPFPEFGRQTREIVHFSVLLSCERVEWNGMLQRLVVVAMAVALGGGDIAILMIVIVVPA